MASSRELKNRIRATKNIRQMTRAMEAVSAVKMRRSTELALSARPYALTALQVLRDLRASSSDKEPSDLSPLFEEREVESICLVIVTADKGLAGAFNASVIRAAERFIRDAEKPVRIIAVGKKGRDHFARRGYEVVREFLGAGDFGAVSDTEPVADALQSEFVSGKSDRAVLIYTNFLSALKQEVVTRNLLPFTEEALEDIVAGIVPLKGKYANIPHTFDGDTATSRNEELVFEPSQSHVLSLVLPRLLKVQVFHAIIEANASEHSSRMMAMKSASENAGDLIGKLTLQFNKARQAGITKELSEITAGKEALEG